MKKSTYHEALQRGTPDFPAELYSINSLHPRYQMQAHWHREFELIRVISGTLRLFLNENEYVLTSGGSAFIPGGIIHRAQALSCEYECIVFSPALLYVSGQCRTQIKQYVRTSVFYKNSAAMNAAFDAMIKKHPGYEFAFLSGVYSLAESAVFEGEKNGSPVLYSDKAEKLKSALAFIEENYNTNFSLAQLAASCSMSPNYFCRFFKENAQKTPFDYINEFRVNIACERIAAGDESITETAYNCGYSDLSYFIKIFKKYKGVSPKAYKKSLEVASV